MVIGMNSTSIFYVNSVGFLCQWKGSIISKDENSISIRFSKTKALRFALKDLDCDFLLVTKTPVKPLGLAVDQAAESVSFDEEVKAKVIAAVGSNVAALWSGKGWAA